ncbi:unnamed protein product [Paramecium sonneborni]|uniref:Uncharacterized protein n=1 Tax=Paramecium sonneborni TaxID=65129 RepID=A0A8S1RLX9_9CILI|nr:unnamed protein product [Paramecium sonneborni]
MIYIYFQELIFNIINTFIDINIISKLYLQLKFERNVISILGIRIIQQYNNLIILFFKLRFQWILYHIIKSQIAKNQFLFKSSRVQMKKNIKKFRTYQKISDEQKKKLLRLVCFSGFKIKNAAKQLNIKYAAAKTYIIFYRNNVMRSKLSINSEQQCQVAPLSLKKCRLTIVSKIGGDVVQQLQFEYPTIIQE